MANEADGCTQQARTENKDEPHLRIYKDYSVLYGDRGKFLELFQEGAQSPEAKTRMARIEKALHDGYLDERIDQCRKGNASYDNLSDGQKDLLRRVVDAVTSECGRGVVGLLALQLTVKAIEPGQCVRLHKAGRRDDFSWTEGVSMRHIDAKYISPILRQNGLKKSNKDGVMMTRTLAENYPYSRYYKASIKGAKDEWLEVVELLETSEMPAGEALDYYLHLLIAKSGAFQQLADSVSSLAQKKAASVSSLSDVRSILVAHMGQGGLPAARLLEVAMHSMIQALEEMGATHGLSLVPLSQMRQANKKAGNIADIELASGDVVVEAWDAKFGKPYLYDELYELEDKLKSCAVAPEKAGFVTDGEPSLRPEIMDLMEQISAEFGVSLDIMSFQKWVKTQSERVPPEGQIELARRWLVAYGESLALKRPEKAPIDEPTTAWLEALKQLLA